MVRERLQKLRAEMAKRNIDIYVVPTADFHESDMDKNTTLLVSSVRADNETLNSQAKIKIEDDPYYFKKYVFSYTNANEQKAIQYLEYKKAEKGLNFSYIEEISEYLLKAEYFKEYKEKEDNLSKDGKPSFFILVFRNTHK